MNVVQNQVKAFIRGVMPFVESSIVASVAHFGFKISPTVSAQIIALGGLGLSAVLHYLETHFKWVGVLLGWIGAPAYAPSLSATVKSLTAELEALKNPQAVVTDLASPTAPVEAATAPVVADQAPLA